PPTAPVPTLSDFSFAFSECMSDTTVRLTQVTESERDRLTDIRCRPGHRRLTRPANGTPTTSCIVGHYSGRFDVISEGLASADEYGESAKKVSGHRPRP